MKDIITNVVIETLTNLLFPLNVILIVSINGVSNMQTVCYDYVVETLSHAQNIDSFTIIYFLTINDKGILM